MKLKRTLAFLLAALFVLGALAFAGCKDTTPAEAPAATRTFTDSTGRSVELPVDVSKIAVSGPLAQITVFALAPEKLVGIASAWDETAEQFLDTQYYQLPVLGQLYGGKGELNLEELLAAAPEVVIDVGEAKDGIADDMTSLTEQTGIPFVHITMTTATMGEAYITLGELLNCADKANELAQYCTDVYNRTVSIANSVDKVDLLYITGDEGHNVIACGSYHSEVIDLLSNNVAVVDEPSSKGTGNEVDMEQILLWNPDYIIFAPQSVYAHVAEDETWMTLEAIQNGNYCEVPFGPYNWMGFPPSVQRILGMLWMAKVLYPEAADYDLYTECAKYYSLFYHCELSQQQFEALTANSLG